MRIFKYKNIIFALTILFMGCDREELLDLPPIGEFIPDTVEDFRMLLDTRNGSSNWLGTSPMYEIDFYMTDDLEITDENYASFFGFQGDQRLSDAIVWAENYGAIEENDFDWLTLYNKIFICNLVTEAMDNPKITGDEVLRNQLRAEAKVHRAFAYWALVNLYAKQYNATTASTDLGVPIRYESELSTNTPRQSVQAVYDLIIEELNDAINAGVLPAGRDRVSGRPSMAAAYGVLAKTHLAMGNYNEALVAVESTLQNYNMLNDYTAIPFMAQTVNNQELIMVKEFSVSFIAQFGNHFISDELINLYEPNDLRLNLYFTADPWTGRYLMDRNARIRSGNSSIPNPNNFIGPTVPEMYLIRAECNARVGNLAAVSEDLNIINATRIPNYTSLPPYTDRAIALTAVKTERRKELVGRGVRLFDLKRYNAYDNDNISITRTINGEQHTLAPNSNRWVLPITRSVMALSPEIEQNPR